MYRRQFLQATGAAFAALAANGCSKTSDAPPAPMAYGPLVEDPNGVLDLPRGFSYRVVSSLGDVMDDGSRVPDKADGMGCFDLGGGRLALVRNHELDADEDAGGTITRGFDAIDGRFVPGGTTHIILEQETLSLERQFRSLGGTIRNCSGGVTPWNTWLTCEESTTGPGRKYGDGLTLDHGWVFEVPAAAVTTVDASPLQAMGRFNHEAACVDPKSGYVYLTEDRDDSVLYRFLPNVAGQLAQGGKLQALRAVGAPDFRNWEKRDVSVGDHYEVEWIDLDNVDAPDDDLRYRAAAKGATLIARGEGIHMGSGEMYACSTSGGAAKLGQILRLIPKAGSPDSLELFFESVSKDQFDFGDNLTIAPNGHLIVCEDQYTLLPDNYLRGVSPDGRAYALARLRLRTELAGACFSPDGKILFVNVYSPTRTLAIRGPWQDYVAT